jgi:RNA polymerase sigma-70 factor (ECF subfamily)
VAANCASDQGFERTLAVAIRVLQDMWMATDLELLERWRAGDRHAGNLLVQRHFLDLRSYFSLKLPNQYEDLVQETFLQLLRNLDQFRGDASFHTYLFCIARNVLAAVFRKQYRAEIDPLSDSLVDLTGQRQSSLLAEREHLRLLVDSLRSLPLADQELVELYFVQRLPARVLGELFKATEGAIRSRIRTTVIRLRAIYFKLAARPHEREVDDDQLIQWMKELRDELRKR